MSFLITRVESYDDHVKTVKYFLRGTRLLLIRKHWSTNYRETFVLGILTSRHNTDNLVNKLNTNTLFIRNTSLVTSPIDIIVPVYNGFDFLDGLFQCIKENTDLHYRLFVVNDASTDKRVLPLLKKYATAFGSKMILIENEHNLGFVKSVNAALKQTTNNVVLINTDVILPKKWASGLLYPIEQDSKVATVTPFSNCATIFSIPEFGDNIFDGDLESINESISCINAPFDKLSFPTGVGFCMAINKEALHSVGLLDEIFERGYGEENDWCQRAIKKGFYNTIAPNLFVWHKHGASFGVEKFKMIERHLAIIKNRYKNYIKDVQKAQHEGIYASLREFIKILFFNSIANSTSVWFCHAWGGGAEMYAQRQIESLRQDSLCIKLCEKNYGYVRMSWYYKEYSGTIYIEHDDILNILDHIKIDSIVVNSITSWLQIPETLKLISDIKSHLKCVVSFRAHDFMSICPSICMVNNDMTYCNITRLEQCKTCKLHLDKQPIKISNLTAYQTAWGKFFAEICDEIIAFSDSTREIYAMLFPQTKDKIKVIPHTIPKIRVPVVHEHDGINIAILGAIHAAKGAYILSEMGKLLPKYKNVTITLIGYTANKKGFPNIIETGTYIPEDLPNIIEEHNIDIIFIPSICPETFSYTTQEAIEMELKTACFNLGAQAERIKNYHQGLVISKIDAKTALDEIVKFCKNDKTETNYATKN
ncbi:MAG: glycosyltransferase [Alphaproteobacteria bacterium]|nr:glycosyltransferase [Alphaproteobacteria bacterium]